MRLAYCVRAIFPQHGFGGLERSATGLLNHLLQRGLDVALYTRPLPSGEHVETGSAKGHLSMRAVRYGRLPLPPNGIPARLTNYRAFADELGRHVRSAAIAQNVRGIYAHGLCAWGVRSAAQWGVPVVANPHGMEEFKIADPLRRAAYAPFRAWLRSGYRAADRVVATDRSMQGEVSQLLGVDPARVVVLPNGVDVEEIRGMADGDLGVSLAQRWQITIGSPDGLLGLSVGRLEMNKAFDNLLRALAQCHTSLGQNWRWLIVGEGTQRASLEALTTALGLSAHVTFVGAVSETELHTLYSMCNLFVHPTLYEGSSLVTLEAMAHGLPVIASATGGIPDKVVEGETGFLVTPGHAEELAAKIMWMASHEQERLEMGGHGLELVRRHFSWEQVAAATETLFYTLIEEKSACTATEVMSASC